MEISLRQKIREMKVGETMEISREIHRPSSVRSTCSSIKADELKSYRVMTTAGGVNVKRVD